MKPFLDGLSQPEYVQVPLNPLPIYGLAAGVLALVVGLAMRSRSAQVTALVVILSCALSAWLVYQYGERGSKNQALVAGDLADRHVNGTCTGPQRSGSMTFRSCF